MPVTFRAFVFTLLSGYGLLAQAQTDYFLYVDADTNPATGCSVTLAGSSTTLSGMEFRLDAQVDASFQVVSVTRESCQGGSFAGGAVLGGGYPVGLNNGTGGADVVEFSDALAALGAGNGGSFRVAFVGTDGSGDDVLATRGGGAPILLGLPSFPIPGLGGPGLVLLVLGLGLVTLVAVRRRPGAVWSVVGLLVLGSALAANFLADGLVGDWTGIPPSATDATGDASDGSNAIDIVAGFLARENGNLFVRLDVADVENAVPTVNPVSVTLLEDDPATTINLSGFDADADPLTFAIASSPTLGTLGTVTGTGPASAMVDYTPSPDANGPDSFTYTANDGSANSAPATVDISITPVNDQPSFTASDPPAAAENAGAQTVVGFASFDPGAANESGQSVMAYTVSNVTNAALFSAGPAVDTSGTLTYTPASGVDGTSDFDLAVQDDGGTANGGVDTSATQTFTITVNFVNSAPSFSNAGDVSSDEDAGAQTVAGWASAIDDGDGSTQTLQFNVTNNTNPALFNAAPAVDATTGNLTYTSAPNANGTADITVELMDDGGTANGGVDTSTPVTFTITVNPVNDPPVLVAPGPFDVIGNVGISVTDGPDDLLAGATDPDGTVLTATAGTVASNQGGSVAINADGTFSYDPPAGFTGMDGFSYQVCDAGIPGSACSMGSVSLSVSGLVWFVDPAAGAGDGRLNSPFNDVDALDAVNDGTGSHPASGDAIFLYSGSHDGSLTLLNGQKLFGQGASASLATMAGLTVPTYSNALPATGGAAPVWTASNATALTVAQNNTLRGFDIGNTGTGIDIAGNTFGTLTVSEVNLSGTGQALDLVTGTLANGTGLTPGFGTIGSSSGQHNVRLIGVNGTASLGGGALSGAANQAFLVSGGTGTFSYSGSIASTIANVVEVSGKSGGAVNLSGNITSNSGGLGIFVNNNTGGTVTLSGATKMLSTGTNAGVSLNNNTGATIAFSNGGLGITTTSGAGFTAAGGGTVTVAGTGNTVTSTTGTAVNIVNTTIGAAGVTFQSVSSNGGANPGIVLTNTGTSGGFAVTGDGGSASNGSGGSIVSKTGNAVTLDTVSGVSLGYMNIGQAGSLGNIADNGVRASSVQNLTLNHCNFRNVANQSSPNEAALFATNPRGTWNVTNSLFDRSWDDHIRIENSTTTSGLSFNLLDSTLQDNDASGNGNDALLYVADGGGTNATFTIQRNTFSNSDGDHVQIALEGSASADVTIGGSNVSDGNTMGATLGTVPGSGISFSSGVDSGANPFSGTLTYLVENNDIQNAGSAAVNVDLSTSSTAGQRYQGTIKDNTIGTLGTAYSGGFGIRVVQNGAGTLGAVVDNNTVQEYDGDHGILLEARDGSGRLNATVINNVVANPGDTLVFDGLGINAGATVTDTSSVCADVKNNTMINSSGTASGGADFVVATTSGAPGGPTVILPGYAGTAKDAPAVVAFVQGQNVGTPTGMAIFSTNSVGVLGTGTSCP